MFEKKLKAIREYRKNIMDIAFNEVLDNEDIIVELITEEQLYEKGIRGDEVEIADFSPYSPYTVMMKQMRGQPTDRVTLRDTGDYHKSFYIKIGPNYFEVMASDSKTEELVKEYGEEIMQFTEENVNEIIWSYIYPQLLKKFNEALAK